MLPQQFVVKTKEQLGENIKIFRSSIHVTRIQLFYRKTTSYLARNVLSTPSQRRKLCKPPTLHCVTFNKKLKTVVFKDLLQETTDDIE